MTDFIEVDIEICEIEKLLNLGYEVEVDSPDGFVKVESFIHKEPTIEHILVIDGDIKVSCSPGHLFETTEGWEYAKDLLEKESIFVTNEGLKKGFVSKTNRIIPIVDIRVGHENHRYYTNGVSSHNTGVGKSLTMCHMAAANLALGKNVLYVTLELAEERIAERIDANLLNITLDDLKNYDKERYLQKIERVKSKTKGKLFIKEYPTTQASVANIRYLLNELRLKKNFVPDIIYIDYLNIMSSARVKMGNTVNSYTLIKSVAEEVRGLAVEFNLPIVTATQTNRSGANNSDIEMTDTSDSFGVPMTADFMMALVTSEELEELNQYMCKVLKNRYNDPSICKRFVIGVDRSRMRLYDVDESEQTLIDDKPKKKQQEEKPIFDKSSFGDSDAPKKKFRSLFS